MAKNPVTATPSIILIGGSAGSLHSLLRILTLTPAHFPIPVVLVVHRAAGGDSLLEELLNTKSNFFAREVEEKEFPQPGSLHICPADYHVLMEADGSFALDASEKVNYSRPSIDVTFSAVADVYGSRVWAILLSGANSDGSEGLKLIKERGGKIIVQDPDDAPVPYMPAHAIGHTAPDHILNCEAIGQLLSELAR